MNKAVRAIVVEDGKILLMHRNKYGSQYYTLVGGRIGAGETHEQALVREVMEETGLQVTAARPVFTEDHPEPYNEQTIYLCEIAPHGETVVQDASEEGAMNRYGMNLHQPFWVDLHSFANLAFRTPQLQAAILEALKKGFPKEPAKVEDNTKPRLIRRIKSSLKRKRSKRS
jgi:8-oxo-dGTP pyrophosphatase MutT (NUDIX family)